MKKYLIVLFSFTLFSTALFAKDEKAEKENKKRIENEERHYQKELRKNAGSALPYWHHANNLAEIKSESITAKDFYIKAIKIDSTNGLLQKDYGKYFDFKKPGVRLSTNPNYNPGGVTVGMDLDEFINMFRFKRTRSLEALQKRLMEQEQDKYIDHRFSKPFVRKVTHLQSPELENFMRAYRPTYELCQMFNDLELGYYIEKCYDQYKLNKTDK